MKLKHTGKFIFLPHFCQIVHAQLSLDAMLALSEMIIKIISRWIKVFVSTGFFSVHVPVFQN